MKYSNELQNIDSPNKAYLLGLFYADGNISKNQHHSKLYLVDKELIMLIKSNFPFFNYYTRKTLFGVQSGVSKVRKDFICNGCLPSKSMGNKNLMRLPFINDLTFDFIRGYFDGDGGCTLTFSSPKVQKRVYIYSASLLFIEDIANFLSNKNIGNTITNCDSKYKGRVSRIYKLSIKTESYQLFYDNLYTTSELFLIRKKELLKKILETTSFFVQKVSPKCMFCSSANTVRNGNYTYNSVSKQKILCKDCKRNFTLKTAPLVSNN